MHLCIVFVKLKKRITPTHLDPTRVTKRICTITNISIFQSRLSASAISTGFEELASVEYRFPFSTVAAQVRFNYWFRLVTGALLAQSANPDANSILFAALRSLSSPKIHRRRERRIYTH